MDALRWVSSLRKPHSGEQETVVRETESGEGQGHSHMTGADLLRCLYEGSVPQSLLPNRSIDDAIEVRCRHRGLGREDTAADGLT
jgi:hypothetical protein